MIVAHNAGIPVFVTGGIGGVHRAGEKSKRNIIYFIFKELTSAAILFSFPELVPIGLASSG